MVQRTAHRLGWGELFPLGHFGYKRWWDEKRREKKKQVSKQQNVILWCFLNDRAVILLRGTLSYLQYEIL